MLTKTWFANLAAVGLPVVLLSSVTFAAPPAIVVDTTDGGLIENNGLCSLAEAIGNANDNNQTYADCDRPKGNLARIDLTNPGGDEIVLQSPLLISVPVEITGPGSSALTITRAVANNSHFKVDSAVTLTGVRLTNAGGVGSITVDDFAPAGGGPFSLTLEDVVFSGNFDASTGGAAINLFSGASAAISGCKFFNNHTTASGGAISIENGGSLTVFDSVFVANFADGSGGAIRAINVSVTITDSVFAGNDARLDGGAIFSVSNGVSSDTTISNSSIIRNFADGNGGGYYGQAFFGSTLDTTITGSVIADNQILADLEDVFLDNDGGGGTNNYNEVNSIVDVCTNC